MKEIVKILDKHVMERGIDRHNSLEVLCDFLIDLFEVRHYSIACGWEKYMMEKCKEEPYLFCIAMIWMDKVASAMEKGEWVDFFGELYEEMYQTRGKASALGQFFTPGNLCDLLAKCTETGEGQRINDSACGSGRTLLAHFAYSKFSRDGYYIGEDIDAMSVKMCALNMMIHGMRGRVVRHNTLVSPIHFDYGFEVNEIRHPFPSMYYSLRRIACKKDVKTNGSENVDKECN